MSVASAIALCLGSGYLLVGSAWPSSESRSDLLLRLSLSVGFGVGIFSVVFFLARVFDIDRFIAIDMLIVALLAAMFFLRRSRARIVRAPKPVSEDFELPRWLHRLLMASFAISVCAALYSTALRIIDHPHGDGWDAFAIWDLHARFLFRGGSHWRDGFSALIPWSHPDYPLLLPAAIAHFWTYLGNDNPMVPTLIGVAFAFGTLGLLYSSLSRLRGHNAAMLGGLALSSTPFFVEQGTAQYADVPVSFFFLAAIALFSLYHQKGSGSQNQRAYLVLSGVAFGFAAWTKNEGILFALAAVTAQLLVLCCREHPDLSNASKPQGQLKQWLPLATLAVAMSPGLALVFWFKHSVAPPSDLFSSPATMFHRIFVPVRYWAVLEWYAKEFFRFGHWRLIPGTVLLGILYFTLRDERTGRQEPAFRASFWTLAFTLAGYSAIYLITPYDIYWHLRFSLSRLFLQVWPSAIFLFFASIPARAVEKSQNEA